MAHLAGTVSGMHFSAWREVREAIKAITATRMSDSMKRRLPMPSMCSQHVSHRFACRSV